MRIAGFLAATALVVTGSLAPSAAAAGDGVVVTTSQSECWGKKKTKTLVHFVIFNHTSSRVRYTVTYQRAGGRERSYGDAVPRSQGVYEGIVIPPRKRLDHITVTVNGETLYYRTDVTGMRKCERRAR